MLIRGDARSLPLRDGCVDCVVTSPPYFGLRDYGCAQQIGLEPTPDAYVAALVIVFREVWRVLKPQGVAFLNLGDSYNGSGKARGNGGNGPSSAKQLTNRGAYFESDVPVCFAGFKAKDLLGIPWRVAFALQADGWVLRQEIVWAKPNPMPESVGDRCTKSHEQLFMFAKAKWRGPAPSAFAHISDADARWLALLFDAEGNIVVKRSTMVSGRTTYGLQVAFANTSRKLIDIARQIVGTGSVHERPGKNAVMWYWQLANIQAAELMKRIYPFLIIKQRQARLGIHIQSLFESARTERLTKNGRLRGRTRSDAFTALLEKCWATMKLLNHFGQPDLSWVPEPIVGRWGDCEDYYFDAAAIAEPVSLAMLAEVEQGYDGLGLKEYETAGVQNPSTVKARIIANVRARRYPTWEERKADGAAMRRGDPGQTGDVCRWAGVGGNGLTRNKRSVWTVNTEPYVGAHFATMPEALVEPCILAGSPLGGVILDPFIGSGTVGAVAERVGRRWVGVDLAYQDLARERTAQRGLRFVETSA